MEIGPGHRLDLAGIEKTVKEAGFDLKWAEPTVVGSITKEPAIEALTLALRDEQGTVLLVPGHEESTRRNFVEVARWAGSETPLRIAGRAHVHAGRQVAMTVSSFEVVRESR